MKIINNAIVLALLCQAYSKAEPTFPVNSQWNSAWTMHQFMFAKAKAQLNIEDAFEQIKAAWPAVDSKVWASPLKSMLTSTYKSEQQDFTEYPVTLNQLKRMLAAIIKHEAAMKVLMQVFANKDQAFIRTLQEYIGRNFDTAKEQLKSGNIPTGLATLTSATVGSTLDAFRFLGRVTNTVLTLPVAKPLPIDKKNKVIQAFNGLVTEEELEAAISTLITNSTKYSESTRYASEENRKNQIYYALAGLVDDTASMRAFIDMVKNPQIKELSQFVAGNFEAMKTLIRVIDRAVNTYEDIVWLYGALSQIETTNM